MKMPSTYISLFLLCVFVLIFYYTHKDTGNNTKPVQIRPVVKSSQPVVKKSLPADAVDVYLSKNQKNENKNQKNEDKQEQAGLNENGFSFFKDVITHISPALKNLNWH